MLQTDLPSGTRYEDGHLYMRLDARGTVRIFLPRGSHHVEVSSGNIYDPQVHYTGPADDLNQLLRFIDGFAL